MTSKTFPPPFLRDLSRRCAGHAVRLASALASNPCTVLVGAGLSASCGLPAWTQLLRNIASVYLTHWEFDILHQRRKYDAPPRDLSIAFWEDSFWSDDTEYLADRLTRSTDALAVAQMVLSRVAESNHQYLIRKALYGRAERVGPSDLVQRVADLCCLDGVSSVVSYNYDDVLEQAVRMKGNKLSPVWNSDQLPLNRSKPILYPHGYLKQGGGPLVPLVLGEYDYHSYATDHYDWRNLLQLQRFSSTTCIFVGCSLADPHIRRLLWVAQRGARALHYAFLASDAGEDRRMGMLEALNDAQMADLGVRVIRYPAGCDENRHSRLPSLLAAVEEMASGKLKLG